MLVFLPVYISVKLDPSAVPVKINLLPDQRIANSTMDFQGSPESPHFSPFQPFHLVCIPAFFSIVNIYIPVVIVHGLVFIHAEQVGLPSCLKNLPLVFLIIDFSEEPILIKLDPVEWGFQVVVIL